MYTIDLTVIVSAILGASAIIAPIITTIISNCHATKIYKLNMAEKRYQDTNIRIRTIFETYIRATGHYIKNQNIENESLYSESYFHALLYAPDDIRSEMIAINTLISDRNSTKASEQLEQLVSRIHEQLLLK